MPRKPFLGRIEEIFRELHGEPAVIGADGSTLRTFGEIAGEAGHWAGQIKEGGCVLLYADNCAGWPGALLGIWMAGATAVPCEPSIGEPEPIETLCGCTARIARTNGRLSLVNGLPSPARPAGVVHADLLKITSGTTAARRAVVFTGNNLMADARNVCTGMGIARPDRNLAAISFAHSYGLTNLIGALFFEGVPLVLAKDSMPRALAEAAAAGGASVFPGVPAFFRALAGVGTKLHGLRLCISAGAPLARRDALAFFEATGRKAHSFYGASECGGICYDAGGDPGVPEGFVGPPLPGVEIKASAGEEGLRFRVGGDAVGRCYVPAQAGDALSGGFYEPSDILEETRDGFRIIGRVSDFINIGGRKANPAEIEAVLLAHPGVQAATVFAGTSPGGREETVAACVVTALPTETLRAHCAGHLPAWQLPRDWFRVKEIPCTERGKVSRLALRRRFFPSPYLPPGSDVPQSK